MIQYPQFDPVILHLGPLALRWYGFMYLIGFAGAWALATLRAPKQKPIWTQDQISDLVFYVAVGVVVGGRLGYMLIYSLPEFMANPLSLFEVWQGGMSFHGGLLGVCASFWLLARKYHLSYWTVADFVAPLVPVGLGTGRLGNFINGELWGRVTHISWAMIFPEGGLEPRHPSQLYEFLLEGLLLFIIVWVYSAKPRPRAAVSGLFLLAYGIFRFSVEFFREPDIQLGLIGLDYFSMGQLLSLPMIIMGALLMGWAYQSKNKES